MGLFRKGDKEVENNNEPESEEIEIRLKDYKGNEGYYLLCMLSLNKTIKEFSFQLEEINADSFQKHLDDLFKAFIAEKNELKQEQIFERYIKIIKSFIGRKKEYYKEKEEEFKSIVKLLTEGITVLNSRNQDFNKNLFEHSSKLMELDKLDNIKKIKKILKQEVDQIRSAVKEKEENDAKRLRKLSQEVMVLRDDLEKAETASITDKLTGANNRHAFDSHIKNRVEMYGLVWAGFSTMMIDIDNFKSVNDTYGHLTGDKVIAEAVKAAQSFLRKDDFMARYGGEEFVIILDGASLKNAITKAKMICEAIAKLSVVIDEAKPEKVLNFTVSIGVSAVRDGDTELTIIDRADKALYKAKQTGKNRVVHEKEL